MHQPIPNAVPLTLYVTADDGGDGPTVMPGDFHLPSGDQSEYEVPEGSEFQLQHVGLSLEFPATGESAWGVVGAVVYYYTDGDTVTVPLAPDVLAGPPHRSAPGLLGDGHWCFFDAFGTAPGGVDLYAAVDNPGEARARAKFVLRGWLVPVPGD